MVKKWFIKMVLIFFLIVAIGFFIENNIVKAEDDIPPVKTLVEQGVVYDTWDNGDGNYTSCISSNPINYYNGSGWNKINTSFRLVPEDHIAYSAGYRAYNPEGLFQAFFKQYADANNPVGFVYDYGDITHVLKSKLAYVGYLDPEVSLYNYTVLWEANHAQGEFMSSSNGFNDVIHYEDVFPGDISVNWTYESHRLKQDIFLTEDTKNAILGNPPSDFGFNNDSSYFVFVTQLDFTGLKVFNGSSWETGNFTVKDNTIRFKDLDDDIKFSFPINYVYEKNNLDNKTKLTYKIIQYNGNVFLVSGLKRDVLLDMSFPLVFDPTTSFGEYNNQNGVLYGSSSGNWNTIRDSNSAGVEYNNRVSISGKQNSGTFDISRGYSFFDTSSINDSATISSASLEFTVDNCYNEQFTAYYVISDSGSSLEVGDFDRDDWRDLLGSETIAFTEGTDTDYNVTLDSNLNSIDKTGVTCIAHLTDYDYNDNAPPNDNDKRHYYSIDAESSIKLWVKTGSNDEPVINSFAVDTEPGANSGWDLDNNDVQVDFNVEDSDGDPVDLYFTFAKGVQARQPTTGDYDYKITDANSESNFDLNWENNVGSWSDYDGDVYVRVRAHDGSDYSDDASPVLYVDYDYLDFGIDGTNPVTSSDYVGPYRVTASTVNIPASVDDLAIDTVTLYYRSGMDNSTWGSWSEFGTDNSAPYQWTFNFPDGPRYYEFYTRGQDEAGNLEDAPGSADQYILHNYAPTCNDEYPEDTAVIGYKQPECSVRVVDEDYNLIDVEFQDNSTGSWVTRSTINNVASNTIQSFFYNHANSNGRHYWRAVIDDEIETVTYTYSFYITGGGCPYIENVIPSNGATVTNIYPNCQFDLKDSDSETVDYEIYENSTGSWVKRSFGTGNAGDTVYWTFNQADSFNETYYWKISLSDGNCTQNYTYHFMISLEPPSNLMVTDTTSSSIALNWDKGAGTTHTLVLYKTGAYPDNPYDGSAATAYFGSGTSSTVGGLSNSTTYYFCAWSYLSGEYSNGYDQTMGTTTSEDDISPGPSNPGGFSVSNVDDVDRLLLQWNIGDDDYVHIRRETGTYPSSITDGIFVYNGSGSSFYDHSLTPGELYYYTAFFESYSKNESANITDPSPPSNFDISVSSGSTMSLSWDNPTTGYYDTVLIRGKNNSFAINENDGLFVYNNTGSSTTHNSLYWPLKYRVWSYVAESGFFAYSDPVDMDDVDGNVVLNVYDENTGGGISNWNIIINSNTGGTIHSGYNKNNAYYLDTGSWTDADIYTFKFTKTNYYSGWYSYSEDEIDNVVNFPVDAYLASSSVGGGNGSSSDWYEILILNEFDIPVEDVRVALYHVNNETSGNQTLTSLWYTDNYGEVQYVNINSSDTYYVNISKTGYQTHVYRWIPSPDDHYKTFKIFWVATPNDDVYNPWDYLTFNAVFSDNTTLVISFEDDTGYTDNAYFEVYENDSGTPFKTHYFYSSSETWTVPFNGSAPHAYRGNYRIRLYINDHNYFNDFNATVFTQKSEPGFSVALINFDTEIAAVAGVPLSGHAIGWIAVIFWALGLFFIVSFGRFWAGVGIASLGLFASFFATVFGVPGVSVSQIIVFAAYCVIYGALYEIAKNKKGAIQ